MGVATDTAAGDKLQKQREEQKEGKIRPYFSGGGGGSGESKSEINLTDNSGHSNNTNNNESSLNSEYSVLFCAYPGLWFLYCDILLSNTKNTNDNTHTALYLFHTKLCFCDHLYYSDPFCFISGNRSF